MVPADQPDRAFNLLGHFLSNHKEWKEWHDLSIETLIVDCIAVYPS